MFLTTELVTETSSHNLLTHVDIHLITKYRKILKIYEFTGYTKCIFYGVPEHGICHGSIVTYENMELFFIYLLKPAVISLNPLCVLNSRFSKYFWTRGVLVLKY
jgi:hypothetical protein